MSHTLIFIEEAADNLVDGVSVSHRAHVAETVELDQLDLRQDARKPLRDGARR
jgi:hypothetical protein